MKKFSTYTYTVIKSAWGVRIVITAEVHLREGNEEERVVPEFSVWLRFCPSVAELPLDYQEKLEQGLGTVTAGISRATKGNPVTVTVKEVSYVESDFQSEGIPVAMCRWAEDAFNLPARKITESFDHTANRYHFTWN